MEKYLETKRIILRQFSPQDEDALLDLDSDPEVMKYLTNGKLSNRHDIKKMMARVSALLEHSNDQFGVWVAIEKETNNFIGWFHLFPSQDEAENLNILFLGFRLKKIYWGKSYATEVSKALIEKAFNELDAVEVCAQAMKSNLASQNVMTKVGMTFRNQYKENSLPKGFQQAVLFSIKKSEYSKDHMAFILFEKGKKIGEIADWAVTSQEPFYKNILGKMVLSQPLKDECTFVSPKPINRKAQLTVIENGTRQFDLQIKSVKGSTWVTATIVSQSDL
ncbi:MAG: GNAT family N-acetyltransferase [Bdellovibrio sp.]|nr:GNAT family N-acetyltransferase [Bdellovibrio sp.]